MTNDQLIERFRLEYQVYHRISADRQRRQRKHLLELAAALDGRSLIEADGDDLLAYAIRMIEANYNVNTVRKHLNMLRPFFSWAYGARLISAELYMQIREVDNPRGSTGKSTPNPYRKAERDAFWAELDAALPLLPERGEGSQLLRRWLRGATPFRRIAKHANRLQVEAMVHLALHCGLRRQEIYGLTVNDLHFDNDYLVVNAKGIGFARRKVPFTKETRAAVRTWLEFREMLRPSHDSPWLRLYGPREYAVPMSFGTFSELLPSLVGPGWTWHRFRHTCATERLRHGAKLEVVSRLLGHSTLDQTLCYAEIVESDIERELDATSDGFVEAVGRAA